MGEVAVVQGKADTYQFGDLVFAKIKGYPPWPAQVQERLPGREEKYSIYFYGSHDQATVKLPFLYPYTEETNAKYGKNGSKPLFRKGMEEIASNVSFQKQEQVSPTVHEDDRGESPGNVTSSKFLLQSGKTTKPRSSAGKNELGSSTNGSNNKTTKRLAMEDSKGISSPVETSRRHSRSGRKIKKSARFLDDEFETNSTATPKITPSDESSCEPPGTKFIKTEGNISKPVDFKSSSELYFSRQPVVLLTPLPAGTAKSGSEKKATPIKSEKLEPEEVVNVKLGKESKVKLVGNESEEVKAPVSPTISEKTGPRKLRKMKKKSEKIQSNDEVLSESGKLNPKVESHDEIVPENDIDMEAQQTMSLGLPAKSYYNYIYLDSSVNAIDRTASLALLMSSDDVCLQSAEFIHFKTAIIFVGSSKKYKSLEHLVHAKICKNKSLVPRDPTEFSDYRLIQHILGVWSADEKEIYILQSCDFQTVEDVSKIEAGLVYCIGVTNLINSSEGDWEDYGSWTPVQKMYYGRRQLLKLFKQYIASGATEYRVEDI